VELTILVPLPVAQAFSLVGDFTRLPEWDPFAASVELVAGSPLEVWAVVDIAAPKLFGGLVLRYEIESVDRPRSIVYAGGTQRVRSRDTVTTASVAGGTVVTIGSEISTRGWMRLAQPLLSVGVLIGAASISAPALKRHARVG
jgi:hypothetical protein